MATLVAIASALLAIALHSARRDAPQRASAESELAPMRGSRRARHAPQPR
jgi:hypothetical protein